MNKESLNIMTTKINFRSVILKWAYGIVEQPGVSFSEVLAGVLSQHHTYRDKINKSYVDRINVFDVYFSRSSDNRVYTKWLNEQKAITRESGELPVLFYRTVSALLKDANDIKYFRTITF